MSHGAYSRRGKVSLLIVAMVALALLVPAVALAAGTPSVTIVGPAFVSQTPPPTAAAPAVNDSYVKLYLQDNGWGADQARFSNDGGTTWGGTTAWSEYLDWYLYQDLGVTLRLDGLHTLTAQFSNDDGATWGASAAATTMVDEQVPVVEAPEGYWNNHHPYRLSAHDQIGLSGVQDLWYRVDAGALVQTTAQAPLGTSTPLAASFALAGATGTAHTIDYIARDYAGNYSGRRLLANARAAVRRADIAVYATSAYVLIDRTRPTVKARGAGDRWHHGPVVVSFSASDSAAGVDRIEYSVTGIKAKKPGAWTTGNSVTVSQTGRHKVWFRAVDKAQPIGNASANKSVIVKILH
jgi:hypothetical protein